ncbi:MAG: DUF4905 domain-containing protein [Sphingobacteriaceae bacterium]|nr:MAG: DUF4905 domain-containing protein [Sphingobacteriaceae bacterium]
MLTLQPNITHQFNAEIWRIEIDETTANLLLEIRNQTEKQVSFASINLDTGILNFEGYTLPERWLAGIETTYKGVLLLHNYQSAAAPVHKAVIAIDENSGEMLWSNYTMAFDHLSVNGPVVYNTQFQPKKYFVVDVRTGAMLKPYENVIDTEYIQPITTPEMVSVEMIANLGLPVEPYGQIVHYVEYNSYRIVSLHTFNEGLLKQHLYIINPTGGVYEYLLNTDIQKLQPEAFVLHKNRLICLKNKTEIMVFEL